MPKGVRNGRICRGRPGAFPPYLIKPTLRSFCTSFSIFSMSRGWNLLCACFIGFASYRILSSWTATSFRPWHLCIAECKHITELLERLGILHHFFRSKVGHWWISGVVHRPCQNGSAWLRLPWEELYIIGGSFLSDAARVKAWSYSSSSSPDSSLSELY